MNKIVGILAKRRWMKRLFKPLLPPYAYYTIPDIGDIYYRPKDFYGPSFHLSHRGFFDYEDTDKNRLFKALPAEGVFYDIGANIGLYALYGYYLKPQSRIICFEPNSHAYQCLKQTVESLPNPHRIEIHKKAIGETDGEENLYVSSTCDGGHSLFVNAHDKSQERFEKICMINLDRFAREKSLPLPHVVKIDVEGYELGVLKGMRETIEKAKPSLLIECNRNEMAKREGVWPFLAALEPLGLFAQIPGESPRLTMEELATAVTQRKEALSPLTNFYFSFDPKGF